jgi:hypothetical protein
MMGKKSKRKKSRRLTPEEMEADMKLMQGRSSDPIRWCLHCERIYHISMVRQVYDNFLGMTLGMCAYSDCDGDDWGDSWPYHETRARVGNVWPLVPQPGVIYELSGRSPSPSPSAFGDSPRETRLELANEGEEEEFGQGKKKA